VILPTGYIKKGNERTGADIPSYVNERIVPKRNALLPKHVKHLRELYAFPLLVAVGVVSPFCIGRKFKNIQKQASIYNKLLVK